MSALGDIRAALEGVVAGIAGIPSHLAWQNVRFTPPDNATWVQLDLSRSSIRPITAGPSPQLRHEGLFFLRIHSPQGRGPMASDDLADAIRKAYAVGNDFTAGSVIVRTRSAEVLTPVSDPQWFVTTVVVDWYCFTPD